MNNIDDLVVERNGGDKQSKRSEGVGVRSVYIK